MGPEGLTETSAEPPGTAPPREADGHQVSGLDGTVQRIIPRGGGWCRRLVPSTRQAEVRNLN